MKKIVTLLTCLLLGASLNADVVKGPYVGVGFGASQFDDGGLTNDMNTYIVNHAGTYRVAKSFDSTGFKLYGGYQFNKIIALEASYTNYGEHSYDFSNGHTSTIKPASFGLSANLGYNLGRRNELRPFVKLGIASINLNESADTGYELYSKGDTATALKVGLGLDYNPFMFKGFGFRLAYEGDFFGYDPHTSYSEYKSIYTQYASMYYFGVHYKF